MRAPPAKSSSDHILNVVTILLGVLLLLLLVFSQGTVIVLSWHRSAQAAPPVVEMAKYCEWPSWLGRGFTPCAKLYANVVLPL